MRFWGSIGGMSVSQDNHAKSIIRLCKAYREEGGNDAARREIAKTIAVVAQQLADLPDAGLARRLRPGSNPPPPEGLAKPAPPPNPPPVRLP